MKLYDKLISRIPGNMPRAPKGHTWSVEVTEDNGYRKSERYSVILFNADGEAVRKQPLEQGYGYSVTDPTDVTWPRILRATETILDKIENAATEKKIREAKERRGNALIRTYGTKKKGAVEWLSSMTSRPDS